MSRLGLTIEDLRELCDRYVPRRSRHKNSLFPESAAWWFAHEIGHLVVASPSEIGLPLFGLDGDEEDPGYADPTMIDRLSVDMDREHYLRCMELAAMTVSGKLLRACGRADLAEDEAEETDYTTMTWEDDGRVGQILRQRRALRIPRSKRSLEQLLARKRRRAKSRSRA